LLHFPFGNAGFEAEFERVEKFGDQRPRFFATIHGIDNKFGIGAGADAVDLPRLGDDFQPRARQNPGLDVRPCTR
jgi:hypothetical protein